MICGRIGLAPSPSQGEGRGEGPAWCIHRERQNKPWLGLRPAFIPRLLPEREPKACQNRRKMLYCLCIRAPSIVISISTTSAPAIVIRITGSSNAWFHLLAVLTICGPDAPEPAAAPAR